MTTFYLPVDASNLCPLPSTFCPLTFSSPSSHVIITAINIALLHNALAIKRLRIMFLLLRGEFMLHDGVFVFSHGEVITRSFT